MRDLEEREGQPGDPRFASRREVGEFPPVAPLYTLGPWKTKEGPCIVHFSLTYC